MGNRRRRRLAPRLETLENIALLSTLQATPFAAKATTGLGSTGSVTTNDALALQQDASGGFLEQYISQIEVLEGRKANVRQYAQSVIANHQTTSYDLQVTAGEVGVSLPVGIALPSDLRNAQQVLSVARGANLDRTYLKVMAQINAQDIADDQQLISTTQNAAVKAYAQETEAYDQNHLQGAQQLTASPKSTYTPTVATSSITPPPSSDVTASASDTQALQQDESGGYLEQFISQIEGLRGSRSDAQQFAQTVVGDHQVTNFDLETTANTVGVTLPSGITDALDIQDARKVLASGTRNLDRNYLSVMAQVNGQDVTADQQLIASTRLAAVKAYAQETESYDMTHVQGAQMLLSQKGQTYTPNG